MSTPDIQSRIATFVSELEAMVRAEALQAVQAALTGSAPTAPKAAPAAAKAPTAAAPAKAPTPKAAKRSKGAKRDPEEIARMADAVLGFIKKNPGKGVEEIGKAMGIATAELKLPILKLIEKKAVSRKGQKRATKYFA